VRVQRVQLQELQQELLPQVQVLPQEQVLQELPRLQVQRVPRMPFRIHHKKLRHRGFLFRN
jgi:hypothetical protein